MKKTLFTLLAAAVITVSCNNKPASTTSATDSTTVSNSDASQSGGAAITFEKKDYDFGKITDGAKVSHEFKFTNTGTAPLIISDATATCGCTVPEFPKEPIAPGQNGIIKVIFDSSGKVGVQHKVITITSNASPEIAEVYITGEVQAK